MKLFLRCSLWVIGLLLLHFQGLAQTRAVTGTVLSITDKSPLPGVTVAIKGESKGTVTDSDGKFTIEAEPENILVFSFIGMETQELQVGSASNLTVELTESLESLSEVVIVAYGSQKRSNVSGAVSTVDVGKNLESRPVTDVGRALQGASAGLIITSTSGDLGGSPRIRIRGSAGTITKGSTDPGDPLIMVDNVEVPDMSYVNPDDIESISVLKDASTTAIYGARAAFGAVLITTKKGNKDGKVKVSYSNNFSWSTPTNVPEHSRADLNLQYSYDQMNALKTTPTWEYGQVGYFWNPDVIAKVKNWIDTYGDGKGLGREMVEGRDFDYRPNSSGVYYYRPWDIYDMYYKDWTPQQNQNISVNGGNDKVQYSFSGALMNQNGVLKLFDDNYKRINASGFVSSKVNKWLTLRGGFMYTKTSEVTPFVYGAAVYDPMYYLYRWHQVYPYGTYDGKEFRGGVNDLKSARPEEWDTYYSRYNFGTTLNLAEGLSANFDYTYNQTVGTLHRVGGYLSGINQWNVDNTPPNNIDFESLYGVYSSPSFDYVQNTQSKRIRNTVNAYLTYDKVFGAHAVKVMGGTNLEDEEYTYISAKREGVFDFDKPELDLAGGTQTASSDHSWWSVAGFFGRINYGYKDKYLFEVNGRYDGTSKFAANRGWAFLPSASAAWRVSEEPWMKSIESTIGELKVRASYGELGNQDVPQASYFPTLTVTSPTASGAHWLINNNWIPVVTNAPLITDPTLTWETVSTLDFGVDASVLEDKFDVTLDWYQRKTTNILSIGQPLPASVGADAAVRNHGELTTNGIEVSLGYKHTFDNGLNLRLTGQFTDYKTTVTKYGSAADPLLPKDGEYYQGQVLGEIWGYKTDGLFQPGDFQYEADGTIVQTVMPDGQKKNTPVEGVATQYRLESGLFKYGPGDVRFSDLNGDGVIDFGKNTVGDHGDKTVIGNTTPRYQFGFRVGADWKGFDLNVFIQGVGQRHIWAQGNMVLPGFYGTEANFAHTLDYWSPTNTGAFYPRPMEHSQTQKWNYEVNDRYLLNAAYVRLKTLTLGYTVPRALTSKINVERVRVYVNAENLFELDKMGDIPIDPELDWTTNTANDKRAFGRSYPYRRTLSFGLQLQL